MAHIEVQPDGRTKVIYEKYTYNSTRRRGSKLFPKGAPKAEIKKFIAQKENEYYLQHNTASSNITLEQFAHIYLEITDKYHSPSTRASDRSLLYNKKHGLVTMLGNCRLDKLKLRNIQTYVDTMTDLSSKTKTNYIMLLRAMLNMARKWEYITFERNPVEDIVIVRTRPNERTPYTIEEARIILDEVSRCDDNNTKMIIFLGLTCGLRRSEIAGLQIKDVDYEDCSISISHARVAAGHMGDFEKAPKSYNGYRKIYVTEELMELLKQERDRKNDSDYLLTDEYNNPLRVYKISELYRKFMQKLDIEYKSLHSLRHTYASILASKGVNAKNIQYTLGHSSFVTSMNIYVGVFDDDCRRMTESLQKTLF